MKALIILIFTLSLVPVSIFTMILGWGLEPHNWGWIAFGYSWMIIAPLLGTIIKEIS